jgi:hypothetical protein
MPKHYYPRETDDWIDLYNKAESPETRNEIYNQYLHVPISKLIENIIHRFKFYYYEDTYEALHQEVLSYILEKLCRYDKSKAKSFSYLSVITKNYLIAYNYKRYNSLKNSVRITQIKQGSGPEESEDGVATPISQQIVHNSKLVTNDSSSNAEAKEFIDHLTAKMQVFVEKNFNKPGADRRIAYAVLDLINTYDEQHLGKKRKVYFDIKETAALEVNEYKKIYSVIKQFREEYRKIKNDYYDL